MWVAAAAGFLCNAKALLVLAACGVLLIDTNTLVDWRTRARPLALLTGGFLLPCAVGAGWLAANGAWTAYLEQVWRWPAIYAASPLVSDPVRNGLLRTVNWLGFHAALVIGGALWWRERMPHRWKLMLWLSVCAAGVVLGWRFFPRYYFLVLPPLGIMAARGLAEIRSRAWLALVLLAMAVPAVRFGPRYFSLQHWSDLALDEDSRAAAAALNARSAPGATLFVWGYRPELYVYTGLKPATKYLESQAMTGVPADRHLSQSTVVLTTGIEDARRELARSRPDFIADGLSLYKPALAMDRYQELRPWLAGYREVARTHGTVIYTRTNP